MIPLIFQIWWFVFPSALGVVSFVVPESSFAATGHNGGGETAFERTFGAQSSGNCAPGENEPQNGEWKKADAARASSYLRCVRTRPDVLAEKAGEGGTVTHSRISPPLWTHCLFDGSKFVIRQLKTFQIKVGHVFRVNGFIRHFQWDLGNYLNKCLVAYWRREVINGEYIK